MNKDVPKEVVKLVELVLDISNLPETKVKKAVLSDGSEWALQGKCKSCARCCIENKRCEQAIAENSDGRLVYSCQIYWQRPWDCWLYPFDPTEPLLPECGFYWEKVR